MSSAQPRLLSVQCLSPAGLHRMAYEEWGAADNPNVLVCVHGLTRSAQDFVPFAQALAKDYRVVCPDVVGRGRSDWLRDPRYYTVPNYIGDMVTLLARLNAQTVHWVGTSMGGLIGMGLAALPDSPLQKLVLNDVGPVLAGCALQRIAEYVGATVRFQTFAEAVHYIRSISASFGEHSDQEWEALTHAVARERQAADGQPYWCLHYDPAIAVPFKAGLPADVAVPDMNLWAYYDAIRCPVLAIRGAQSDLLSAETHAAMAARGPRAQLAVIEHVGHAPTLRHQNQIELVRHFLLA